MRRFAAFAFALGLLLLAASLIAAQEVKGKQTSAPVQNASVPVGDSGYLTMIDNSASILSSSVLYQNGGKLGVGTIYPTHSLDVENSDTSGDGANLLYLQTPSVNGVRIILNSTADNGHRYGIGSNFIMGNGDFGIYDYTAGASRMLISSGGNVGIGTTGPTAALEVNGNVKLTSDSGATIMFADGTVQNTAWTGAVCGGDYAESVDVSGQRSQYEPGDVLVIDPANPGSFIKSAEPYSTGVAGIYSTKPGVVGRRSTDADKKKTEIPMAMVGIVPTKVSAENGSIRPGDLLVTSSMIGYAMKGTDRSLIAGAVVGKALGTLNSGTGVIEVLVSLQ